MGELERIQAELKKPTHRNPPAPALVANELAFMGADALRIVANYLDSLDPASRLYAAEILRRTADSMPEVCRGCDHAPHEDECEEVVGYDHMNGDHECGCPGDFILYDGDPPVRDLDVDPTI